MSLQTISNHHQQRNTTERLRITSTSQLLTLSDRELSDLASRPLPPGLGAVITAEIELRKLMRGGSARK